MGFYVSILSYLVPIWPNLILKNKTVSSVKNVWVNFKKHWHERAFPEGFVQLFVGVSISHSRKHSGVDW